MNETRSMETCRLKSCPNKMDREHARGYCQKHYYELPDVGRIAADESQRHVASLRGRGLSFAAIAEMAGLDQGTIRNLGRWSAKAQVTLGVHYAIMDVPIPGDIVDARVVIENVGTRRRLQALAAIGYSNVDIAKHLGFAHQNVHLMMHSDRVTAATTKRVKDLFDKLQLTPGPSRRTMQLAKKKGWPPPLAWDEETIDDPNAEPVMVERKNSVDWFESYSELRDMGFNNRQISGRLGVRVDSIEQRLRRMRAA